MTSKGRSHAVCRPRPCLATAPAQQATCTSFCAQSARLPGVAKLSCSATHAWPRSKQKETWNEHIATRLEKQRIEFCAVAMPYGRWAGAHQTKNREPCRRRVVYMAATTLADTSSAERDTQAVSDAPSSAPSSTAAAASNGCAAATTQSDAGSVLRLNSGAPTKHQRGGHHMARTTMIAAGGLLAACSLQCQAQSHLMSAQF